MIKIGKETFESLHSLEIFNVDIVTLKREGFMLTINDQVVNIRVDITGYMMDEKTANSYLGLHGSYCGLCSFSKQHFHYPEIVEEVFYIDRSIESINAIFEELSNEQATVARSRDYDSRTGVTQCSISSISIISFQILHGILRTLDFVINLDYHPQAEVLDWRKGASIIYLHFLKNTKSEIEQNIQG